MSIKNVVASDLPNICTYDGNGRVTGLTVPSVITGGTTGTTAFQAGPGSDNNIALGMPYNGAIRSTRNGADVIYFDVSTGGGINGQFQFRSSSSFTQFAIIDSNGINAISSYKGKLPWNSAIGTELTVGDYRFRVNNDGGIFPEIISNAGGTVNTAWTAVAALSGVAIAQAGSTGVLLPNNAWTNLYNLHGMDASGDTITVTLQNKTVGKIYRITFMRSDAGGNTGYNIIAEQIL